MKADGLGGGRGKFKSTNEKPTLMIAHFKVLGKKSPILCQQRFYDHSKSSVTVIPIQITGLRMSYILTT